MLVVHKLRLGAYSALENAIGGTSSSCQVRLCLLGASDVSHAGRPGARGAADSAAASRDAGRAGTARRRGNAEVSRTRAGRGSAVYPHGRSDEPIDACRQTQEAQAERATAPAPGNLWGGLCGAEPVSGIRLPLPLFLCIPAAVLRLSKLVIRHAAEKVASANHPHAQPTAPGAGHMRRNCALRHVNIQLRDIDRAGMAVKIFTTAHQALPASAGGDAAQNVRLRASRKK
jgi:hypothetical protein